jgi:hypothetical protein
MYPLVNVPHKILEPFSAISLKHSPRTGQTAFKECFESYTEDGHDNECRLPVKHTFFVYELN